MHTGCTPDAHAMHTGCTTDAQPMAGYKHSFRPLVLGLTKDHESVRSSQLVMDALDSVCMKYFGVTCPFAHFVTDRSDGLYKGTMRRDTQYSTCWPHIACELACRSR
jgi:hypothetical protein